MVVKKMLSLGGTTLKKTLDENNQKNLLEWQNFKPEDIGPVIIKADAL